MKVKVKAKKGKPEEIHDINSVWALLAYLIKYGKVAVFLILATITISTILILNFNYSKKDGVTIKPTTTIEIKKELNGKK